VLPRRPVSILTRSAIEGVFMFSVFLATAALGTAAGVGVVVGRRRPLLGVLAAVGVLVAAVAGFCIVLELSLPM
jgi:hypothetical protein